MAVLLFTLFVMILLTAEWLAGKRRAAAEAMPTVALGEAAARTGGGLFYAPGHTWSALDSDGNLAIGADGLVVSLLGLVDRVELPSLGKVVKRGDELFSLERGGRKLVLKAPAAGTVTAVNSDVQSSPLVLRLQPDGWIARLAPARLAEAVEEMSIGERAKAWMAGEVRRIRDFFSGVAASPGFAGATLMDGGAPVEGALLELDERDWQRFTDEFLCCESRANVN